MGKEVRQKKRENIESGQCLSIMLRVQVSSRRVKLIFNMHCVSFHDIIYCIVVYRLDMLETISQVYWSSGEFPIQSLQNIGFGPFNLPTYELLWKGRDHSHEARAIDLA